MEEKEKIIEEIKKIKININNLDSRVDSLEKKIKLIKPDKKTSTSSASGWI